MNRRTTILDVLTRNKTEQSGLKVDQNSLTLLIYVPLGLFLSAPLCNFQALRFKVSQKAEVGKIQEFFEKSEEFINDAPRILVIGRIFLNV